MAQDQTNRVASTIKGKLGSLPGSSDHCIYMVPEYIRMVKEECYRPLVVSIGPLYYQHESLKGMQEYKLRFLQFFLEQDENFHKLDLEFYIDFVRDQEDRIRSCYAQKISLPSDEFIEMVLVDSAFVIFYFMVFYSALPSKEKYHTDYMIQATSEITRDLFLEENQLPFFVLQALYHIAFGTAYPETSFLDLAYAYISETYIFEEATATSETTKERIKKETNILHLVDILRMFCLPSVLRDPDVPPSIDRAVHLYHSATELRAAGVKFVACSSKHMLDICFADGFLMIPEFCIFDWTESLSRSLIAFEQYRYTSDSYFTDYMFFLSGLIKTSEDVKILIQNGIIDGNWLDSDEAVADLFNSITKRVVLFSPNFYYSDICINLNAYARNRWNRWKGYFGPRWNEWLAILKKDYFRHPWAAISVMYAAVLLILTLLQTFSGFKTAKAHS